MNDFQYWFRYKFLDWLPEIMVITALLTVVCGLYPLVKWANTRDCAQYQAVTGRETKVVDLTCFVKYNGEWYKQNELKVMMK